MALQQSLSGGAGLSALSAYQLDNHHCRDDGDDDAGDNGRKSQDTPRAVAEDERVDNQPQTEDDDGEG